MVNAALSYNPVDADISITTHGSDWLWAAFSVMALAFVSISAFTFLKVDRGQRTFFYLVQALLATASIAYFCLASDLGATPVTVEFIHGNWAHTGQGRDGLPTRQIWYVRYIDWTITTPLLLLTLLLTAPVPLSTVFMTIFMDLVMIITGLIGALVVSVYKWGFFAFGCAALFWIYYVLFGPARIAAKEGGEDLHKAYIVGTSILSFLWFLYPICWGLADGGNAIHPDSEMVFYGVLDVLAKPVFSVIHLWSLKDIDYSRYGLFGGKGSIFIGEHDNVAGTAIPKNRTGASGVRRESDLTAAENA